jgi:hypothetical protein
MNAKIGVRPIVGRCWKYERVEYTIREAHLRAQIDHLERMVAIRDGELKELKLLVAESVDNKEE